MKKLLSSSSPSSSLFLLLLLSLLFFHFNNAQEECFPYIFDNECTQFFEEGVGGGVLVGGEREQEEVWEEIALSISNVRLMDRSCRRPLVRYLCLESFGACAYPNITNYLEEEWENLCQNCQLAISLLSPPGNCSSPSPSPSPSPFFPSLEDEPIPVLTCLSEDGDRIECCPEPFETLDNDECGVGCYHYLAPRSVNDFMEIYFFVMAWVTSFVLFLVVTPLLANMRHLMRFPNYLYLFIMILTNFTQHVFVLSVYYGGLEDYVCGDNDHFFEIFPEFARSNRCIIQAFLFCFFLLLASYWEAVLAFIMLVFFARATHPDSRMAKVPLFDSKKQQLLLHFLGFMLTLTFSLPILIGSYEREYDPNDPIIGFFFISCVEYAGGFSLIYAVPLVMVSLFCAFFLIACTITFCLYMSKEFIQTNWRSIFFLVVSSCPPIFYSAQVLKAIYINNSRNDLIGIAGFAECVSVNPELSPPPCPVEYFPDYQFDVFVLVGVLFFWPFFVCVVIYFSKPHVWRFWSCGKFNGFGGKSLTNTGGTIGGKRDKTKSDKQLEF